MTEQFQRLKAYNFQSDPEFASGLAIILGHSETPATEAEINRDDDLVLQAKCFFFSRKEKFSPPISFAAYKAWLEPTASASATQQESGSDSNTTTGLAQPSESASAESSLEPGTGTTATATAPAPAPAEPAYPTSFAHIVELITTGQPIPGIEEIPDTVLEGHDLATEKPRRRKPWEKDEVSAATAPAPADSTETTTAPV